MIRLEVNHRHQHFILTKSICGQRSGISISIRIFDLILHFMVLFTILQAL